MSQYSLDSITGLIRDHGDIRRRYNRLRAAIADDISELSAPVIGRRRRRGRNSMNNTRRIQNEYRRRRPRTRRNIPAVVQVVEPDFHEPIDDPIIQYQLPEIAVEGGQEPDQRLQVGREYRLKLLKMIRGLKKKTRETRFIARHVLSEFA
jgi:hypothetical protein